MAGAKSAWGIEIGSYALKALRLERDGEEVRVADFAFIPHKKVLSTPDLDADEMTRLALGQFVSQHQDLGQSPIVMSVPGNTAFARFAKLPPVEPKKVPDIVRFEAVQQIPFPIEEVEWDYQTFTNEGSPDVEVGIFAITKAAIRARLSLYSELGLYPDGVNLSPVAVCNAIRHDHGLTEDSPGVVVMDIGTASTDLIILDKGRISIRTFPIGGHNFTEALISAFNLTYSKAEKLKAEAQTSKYRRQILSAMRPVFSDLAQDAQRSIGHYQSMHRDAELTKLIGVGSTFKLPGLRKFLAQQLQMDISRLDEFQLIRADESSQPQFVENALNYATVYGLALQGLDMASVNVNLVPVPIVRDRMWKQKIKWFGAAAAIVAVGSVFSLARPMMDQKFVNQNPTVQSEILRPISAAEDLKKQFDEVDRETAIDDKSRNIQNLLLYRDLWPVVMQDVATMLASTNPQPELLSADVEAIRSIPPAERRLLELLSLRHTMVQPGEAKDGGDPMPRIRFDMTVRTTQQQHVAFVEQSVLAWLREHTSKSGRPYVVVSDSTTRPGFAGGWRSTTVAGPNDQAGGPGGVPAFAGEGGGRGRVAHEGGGSVRSFGGGGGLGESSGPIAGDAPMTRGNPRGGGRLGLGEGSGGPVGNVTVNEVNQVAPLPAQPDILPPGTQVHVGTVTWTIELLPFDQRDPKPEGAEGDDARGSSDDTGNDNDEQTAPRGRRGG